jgi:hypothetical protein
MKTYKIDFVRGASQGINKNSFIGIHGDLSVQADDKADAYIEIYRQFTKEGSDVTILTQVEFSIQELAKIREAKIPLNTDYPKQGIEIQAITKQQ